MQMVFANLEDFCSLLFKGSYVINDILSVEKSKQPFDNDYSISS